MSKRFKWPCLGLALALVAGVLAPTAWPLITSDFPNSHVLPMTGGTLFGFSPGNDLPPMGDPPPSLVGNKLWVEPLDYTGVAELEVVRLEPGADPETDTTTLRATGSLLSYADRSVLVTAAHVVGDGPGDGYGVRRVEALSVKAIFTKADSSTVEYVQDNTGWNGPGDGTSGGRVFFPPQYNGVVYHGYEIAFIFLDEPVDDPGIASYKLTSTAEIPDPRNRPTVKIGYGRGGYGADGQSDNDGTREKRWGMNVWDEFGIGADNLGVGWGYNEITNSFVQLTYDFDNGYIPDNDAFPYYLPHEGYGTAAENSYGPDEVHQAHGDSGCPSFVIPDWAIFASPEPPVFIQDPSQFPPEWTISGTTSYVIIPDPHPDNPLTTPVNWPPHTGVDYNPQNTTVGLRTWGEFGADMLLTEEEYLPLINQWAKLLGGGGKSLN